MDKQSKIDALSQQRERFLSSHQQAYELVVAKKEWAGYEVKIPPTGRQRHLARILAQRIYNRYDFDGEDRERMNLLLIGIDECDDIALMSDLISELQGLLHDIDSGKFDVE